MEVGLQNRSNVVRCETQLCYRPIAAYQCVQLLDTELKTPNSDSKLGVQSSMLDVKAAPRPLPFVNQLLEKLIEHGGVGFALGGFHDGAL
jgi:hypothetical protein